MNNDPTAQLRTPLCDLLGIRYPIIQAGMAGGPTTPELVAAVSNAGGLGILGAARMPLNALRAAIRAIKAQTDRPFGVNFLLAPPESTEQDVATIQRFLDRFRQALHLPPGQTDLALPPSILPDQIQIVFEERVPVLSIGLGDPTPLVVPSHQAGCQVMAMVTTVAEAVHVVAGGTDIVIAQGAEAGGHRSTFKLGPKGEVPLVGTLALVPQVVDAVNVPVVAAGGIMDGRGLVAALALGAAGVSLGTRFLVARESGASPAYKERLLAATEADTVITRAFTGRPARGVRNRLIEEYLASGVEPLAWPRQSLAAQDIYEAAQARGEADYFPLLAGQGLRLLKPDQGAAEIVEELVAEASEVLARLND
ncbi:MAG: nitronate monooxygenase [Armatimonadota bacterium]|nr:nitronate monooxygenase [Armatimonadota bacterium]